MLRFQGWCAVSDSSARNPGAPLLQKTSIPGFGASAARLLGRAPVLHATAAPRPKNWHTPAPPYRLRPRQRARAISTKRRRTPDISNGRDDDTKCREAMEKKSSEMVQTSTRSLAMPDRNASRSVTFAARVGSFWRTANAVTRIAPVAETADAEPVSLPNHGRNGYEVVEHALGVAHGFNAVRRGADDGPEMISARGLARNSLFGDFRAIARRPITASAFRGDLRRRGALARPLVAAWATARRRTGLKPRKAANHRGSTAVRCAALRVSLAARGPTGLTG